MKSKVLLALALSAVFASGAMSAAAEEMAIAKTVVAKDGLIQIDLPDDNWHVITTAESAAEFSDGNCGIRLNVYKNTTPYPTIVTADSMHGAVYETVGSTKDYIYTIVGLAHDESDYEAVQKAVNSAKVDMSRITAELVDPQVTVEEYSVSAANYSAWVTAKGGLNVRSDSSTDAAAVTVLSYGDKVTVTGAVLHNGIENGWVKIESGSVKGYVSSQFLTTTAITPVAEPDRKADATKTGETKVVYMSDGSDITLYYYSDDTWRSASGNVYWGLTDYEWANDKGAVFYTNKPDTNPAYRTGNSMTLYHGNGNLEIVYEYSDGSYRDDYGISYGGWPGDGYLTGTSGEKLYTYDPIATYQEENPDNTNIILNDADGNYVTTIYDDGASDGSYTDNEKRYYRYNAFGTWICDGEFYYGE